jgi:hypothetical protein
MTETIFACGHHQEHPAFVLKQNVLPIYFSFIRRLPKFVDSYWRWTAGKGYYKAALSVLHFVQQLQIYWLRALLFPLYWIYLPSATSSCSGCFLFFLPLLLFSLLFDIHACPWRASNSSDASGPQLQLHIYLNLKIYRFPKLPERYHVPGFFNLIRTHK